MTDVLLATSRALPEGEPAHEVLDRALADRGLTASWAVWDDPGVDWAGAPLVAVRSTWDYTRRPEEFLRWARDVAARTRLLNGADVFAWNHDKRYLTELDGVPVVPTRLAGTPAELAAAAAAWGRCVVKPRVGAGGAGVWVLGEEAAAGLPDEPPTPGPWVVQPLVESVRTTGEASVFVLGGIPGERVDKLPGEGRILVHPRHGGRYRAAPADPATTSLALRAMAAVGERFGRPVDYGRVDMMASSEGGEDGWMVSELELIEPGLYLDVAPATATAYADLLALTMGEC